MNKQKDKKNTKTQTLKYIEQTGGCQRGGGAGRGGGEWIKGMKMCKLPVIKLVSHGHEKYSIRNVSNNIVIMFGDDGNSTYCDEQSEMYRIVESLYCTSKSIIKLHVKVYLNFIFFLKIVFIYLTEIETAREREHKQGEWERKKQAPSGGA